MEALYARHNRGDLVHPDPLWFVRQYETPRDREVVALLAASLAYGRVGQIHRSCEAVFSLMAGPAEYVLRRSPEQVRGDLAGFRHRFATGDQVACLLVGAGRVIREWGSLRTCFLSGLHEGHGTLLPALQRFRDCLLNAAGGHPGHLLPDPAGGSACKRLHLFLRWLVRRDAVDVGDWESAGPHRLVIPLDTHLHRIGLALGLTRRRQADLRTAEEVTQGFRAISPDDPVRYDFALARMGMQGDAELPELLSRARRAA